jgi:hypothetical protein
VLRSCHMLPNWPRFLENGREFYVRATSPLYDDVGHSGLHHSDRDDTDSNAETLDALPADAVAHRRVEHATESPPWTRLGKIARSPPSAQESRQRPGVSPRSGIVRQLIGWEVLVNSQFGIVHLLAEERS